MRLDLRAGKGGDGAVAWRREKYIPKGGPVGGDGGKGGSILFQTDPRAHSLEAFRNRSQIHAQNGMPGGGGLRKGRNGEDLILTVPCGTLLKDAQTKEILFDFTDANQEYLICKGGRGGKGNHRFKSPTNQAPNLSTPGTEGQARHIELELKLIADIGLIGMPNAGKSTLLTRITSASVKIGAYPFTTLHPNLSFVTSQDSSRVLVADIPGIIENAHQNKGLGLAFLRHVERSAALLFVIDASGLESQDPFQDFLTLRNELRAYNPELLDKPFIVALNKIDQEGADEQVKGFCENYPFAKETLFPISAMESLGLDPLLQAMRELLNRVSL